MRRRAWGVVCRGVRWATLGGVLVLCWSCGSAVSPSSATTTAAISEPLVVDALEYWKGVLGIDYTLVSGDQLPRVLIRTGTDALAAGAAARGGIDGTDSGNAATSALIVIRPG